MSISELLVIAIVAIIVFEPSKLPHLLKTLGKVVAFINDFKLQLARYWQQQTKYLTLEENIKKAQAADEKYSPQSED